MNYLELLLGTLISGLFAFALTKNLNRKGLGNAILRFEILIGLIAGIFLIFKSIT